MCLQSIHNQVLNWVVSQLVYDILCVYASIDIHEGDNGFQSSKLNYLFLVIEHFEQSPQHSVLIKFDSIWTGLFGFKETDDEDVEEFLTDMPRVAID